MEAMPGDVAAVVDALELMRFVPVGHSFGGAVVEAYAGRHPDRVAGLLFVDPIGDFSQEPRERIQYWFDQLKPETYESFTGQWFEQILTGANEDIKRILRRRLFGRSGQRPGRSSSGPSRAWWSTIRCQHWKVSRAQS